MTNQIQNSNNQTGRKYDLIERTLAFSKQIINFYNQLPKTNPVHTLADQLLRSGTSIGANYSEANEASSKKDFINKIYIAKKEAKETQYWIQLIAETFPAVKITARLLWKEAQELNLILAAIIRSAKGSN